MCCVSQCWSIAQFVLPPFQRMGLGARLLNSIYSHYKGDSTVVDITVEVYLLSFYNLALPPKCSRTHQTILWDWETSLMPRTASNWLRSRRIRLVCRAFWPFALHISQGGPGFLRENGRGSCKGVENLQKAGKLSSLLLVPAPHFTWKSIIMIMQWFWLCRRGVCTR